MTYHAYNNMMGSKRVAIKHYDGLSIKSEERERDKHQERKDSDTMSVPRYFTS